MASTQGTPTSVTGSGDGPARAAGERTAPAAPPGAGTAPAPLGTTAADGAARPSMQWPVSLGTMVAVLMARTPVEVVLEPAAAWFADGPGPLLVWLARVSVVLGVVLGRRHRLLASLLAALPFALVPLLGSFEAGWWLGLVVVAAFAAYDRSVLAPVPMLLTLAAGAVHAFLEVPAVIGATVVPAASAGTASDVSPWALFALATVAATAVVAVVGAVGVVRYARRQDARATEDTRRALETESVAAERARVARDLHDVVAHHVSLVAVRAESAPYVHPDLDPVARGVLADIATDARGALDELRQVLVVLQRSDTLGAERAPQPGAGEIAGLVEQARSAGQDARLTWTGPADVPPAPGYVLYRAAQEALTNARRHASGAAVELDVSVADGAARLRASNPSAATTVVPGRGLLGMRERTEALGGILAVTADGGRLTVDVRVPLGGGAL
ncbi:sensor histidine kinase [Actinotalea sp. Marseille-Q4924]|uniref:sensor histidine kinase n=1 Tax=Actinotalea sp. Marseille-Q4924 TaxID=2866571 RepID=UPI001CE3F1EE|nr:histidine kinase [Actinotalea sp. Marseille-Q4924]